MSKWSRIKKRLNQSKGNPEVFSTLLKEFDRFGYGTADRYMRLLQKAGFVAIYYEHYPFGSYGSSLPVSKIKLIQKIPKHLTIEDTHRIAKGDTWLLWMKYYPKEE
jgi:hypothetical protein